MPDLKNDLIAKVSGEKYLDELELVRLAGEPNMIYRIKIDAMLDMLKKIGSENEMLLLIEKYFQEPEPVSQAPIPQAQAQAHNGQSHGE
jgi:hypothetical protein